MIKRLIWKLVSFRGPEFTHCFSYFVTHGLQHTRICKTLNFLGRTDAEAEAPALWPPQVKSWLIGKDSDAGRDWGQEAWCAAIHGIAKSWTQLSDWTELNWSILNKWSLSDFFTQLHWWVNIPLTLYTQKGTIKMHSVFHWNFFAA